MVVFSCDGCGEVLKKNQVDAHANRCRNCASVSCADCMVQFYGDDYRSHTTCMTEAERYEKSVYRPNSKKSAKRNPQDVWMDLIERAAATDAAPSLQHYLQTLATLGNVPRKEKQFRNFTANSLNLRGRQEGIVTDLWKHLSALRQQENDEKKRVLEEETSAKQEKEERNEAEEKLNAPDEKSKSKAEATNNEEVLPSLKLIRKTMKKVLKKEKSAMKFKRFKTRVADELGLSKPLQKKLKKRLQSELEGDDCNIKLDGKMVQLKS